MVPSLHASFATPALTPTPFPLPLLPRSGLPLLAGLMPPRVEGCRGWMWALALGAGQVRFFSDVGWLGGSLREPSSLYRVTTCSLVPHSYLMASLLCWGGIGVGGRPRWNYMEPDTGITTRWAQVYEKAQQSQGGSSQWWGLTGPGRLIRVQGFHADQDQTGKLSIRLAIGRLLETPFEGRLLK